MLSPVKSGFESIRRETFANLSSFRRKSEYRWDGRVYRSSQGVPICVYPLNSSLGIKGEGFAKIYSALRRAVVSGYHEIDAR